MTATINPSTSTRPTDRAVIRRFVATFAAVGAVAVVLAFTTPKAPTPPPARAPIGGLSCWTAPSGLVCTGGVGRVVVQRPHPGQSLD